MSLSVQTTITKMPQNEWLKQQTFISRRSGGWELADLVSGESSLPALGTTVFSLYPHMAKRKKARSLPLRIRTLIPSWAPPS